MLNDNDPPYRGNPDRNRKMQEIYQWADRETAAEAEGRDLHEFSKFKVGVVQIQDEFPEIFGNAELSERVAQMDERGVAEGDRRPYLERYRDYCNAILSGTEATYAGPGAVSDEWRDVARSVQMGDEDEAARALMRISQYSRANAVQSNEEGAEESTSETIERMRRSRVPNVFGG